MIGALLQLNYIGKQDTILTGNPEFNFIKQVYKRNYPFALDEIKILPNEVATFGTRISFDIKKYGDFLHKIFLCLELPVLTSTSGTFAGWTNSIGHAIIDYYDIEINHNLINRNYGLFMEIWNELTTVRSREDQLIGKYTQLRSLKYNAMSNTHYKVELSSWFTKSIGAALPLLLLKEQSIKIYVNLRPLTECVIFDGNNPPLTVNIIDCYLLAQYIFIDDIQKQQFLSKEYSVLIEQLQVNSDSGEYIGTNNIINSTLQFNHPIKELLFILREIQSENNNDWFNFSIINNTVHTPVLPILDSAKLLLDGKARSDYSKSSFELSTLNNSIYHTNTSDKYIYCLPFCSEPEKFFPTGSLNFSMITNAVLQCKMVNNSPSSKLYVFGINYNWITIAPKMIGDVLIPSYITLKYSV